MIRFPLLAISAVALTSSKCLVAIAKSPVAKHSVVANNVKFPRPNRVDRLVTILLNPTLEIEQESEVMDEIETLPLADQLIAYRRLANTASNPEVVSASLQDLIYLHTSDAYRVLEKRLPGLPSYYQNLLISTLLVRSYLNIDKRLIEAMRPLTRKLLTAESGKDQQREFASAIGAATLVLAYSAQNEDKLLIRAALKKFPRASSIWLAAAQAKVIGKEEQELARKLIPDLNKPLIVIEKLPTRQPYDSELRSAIAIALAPYEKDFYNAVHLQSDRSFQEFGKSSDTEVMKMFWSKDSYNVFLYGANAEFISRLIFLNVPFDQNPVSQAIHYKSVLMRRSAYPVIADKYPDDFLKLAKAGRIDAGDPETFEALMAFFVSRHPQQKNQILEVISQARLLKGQKLLQEFGITALLGGGAYSFLGFYMQP